MNNKIHNTLILHIISIPEDEINICNITSASGVQKSAGRKLKHDTLKIGTDRFHKSIHTSGQIISIKSRAFPLGTMSKHRNYKKNIVQTNFVSCLISTLNKSKALGIPIPHD